jgi:hypothetical protein
MRNHSLCILHQDSHGNDYYDNLYNIVGEYLKKGYGVIYAAENNSPDNTIKSLIRTIRGKIDIEDYIRKEALTVIDYGSIYYISRNNQPEEHTNNNINGKNLRDIPSLISRWKSEIQRKQNNKYNHILIVGTCRAFSDSRDFEGLIAYEDYINHKLMLPASSSLTTSNIDTMTPPTSAIIECICCYRASTTKQISSLPLMASIILNHNGTIITSATKNTPAQLSTISSSPPTAAAAIQPLNTNSLTEPIIQAIDDILGDSTGNLIINTMERISRVDKEALIKQPKLFVNTLVKIMGEIPANLILNNILEEIKQQIVYRNSK